VFSIFRLKSTTLLNDEKRAIVTDLIKQTLLLINDKELTFFKTATDEELNQEIVIYIFINTFDIFINV
jgi:Fe-S cluster biosynthesis and repair protein YggX